jgi:hypothetical protein
MEENFSRIERFITDGEEFWLDRKATAKEFVALRKIFYLTLMGQQWGHVRNSYITSERLTLLRLLCAATYRYDSEEQISKEILSELTDEVVSLIDTVQIANLPHALKKALLVNLINVRQTIQSYTIFGNAGLAKAIKDAMADLLFISEDIKAARQPDMLQRLVGLYRKALDVVSAVNQDVSQIMAAVQSVGRLLG